MGCLCGHSGIASSTRWSEPIRYNLMRFEMKNSPRGGVKHRKLVPAGLLCESRQEYVKSWSRMATRRVFFSYLQLKRGQVQEEHIQILVRPTQVVSGFKARGPTCRKLYLDQGPYVSRRIDDGDLPAM